jgi:putative lipoprotein
MLICNDMKAIKYLFSILTVALVFSSCVDYSDASEAVTVKVQLQLPDELNGHMTLVGHTVSLQLNGVTYSAQTDAAGVATFSNIVPDVYNISASWDITSSEYNRITGSSQVINGATVSGSLNSQLINGSEPLLLTTTLSVKRDIVISKIYAAGSKDNNNKRYVAGQYIELYNQSNDSVDVAGLYIGLLETDVPQAYTLENLKTNYADSVVLVKQVFRIPTDKSYKVAPGGTVLLVNSAIDHSLNSPLEHSLLNANFEAKDVKGKMLNNPEVPALQNVFNIYSGISYMNILTTGQGVVIFRSSADISQLKLTYKFGKTSGTQYGLLPKRYIIDGVDFLRHKATGTDVGEKRLYNDIDAGYISINATAGLSGEVIYRKTASAAAGGHSILMDTNNSTNDFQVSTSVTP